MAEHDDDAQDESLATLTHTASGGGYDNVSRESESGRLQMTTTSKVWCESDSCKL